MTKARFPVFVSAVLVALSACAGAQQARGGPAANGGATLRAQVGDTVYLIEHYVRADRRDQFERFVNQVLWPAFQRSAATRPARMQALQQIRLLRPVASSEDGTLTYTFVLDPAVPGETYNVLDILREAYTPEEAQQHYATYAESWARDFTSRPFIRSR